MQLLDDIVSPFTNTFGSGSSSSSSSRKPSGSPTSDKDQWEAAQRMGYLPPGTPNPYTPGPGLQPGTKQVQFENGDLSKAGAAENYYASNKGVWQSPSFGEVNNQGLASYYSDPGNRPGITNQSAGVLQRWQTEMPSIATDPGLGAYFENAKNRAAESINQAMAARGAYGSSAANDQTSRAFTDLEGQRALKEADYNLARLGEQRNWLGLGGQLAGQTDSRSDARAADEQRWAQLLSQLGLDASRLGLQRTNAGMDAAGNAQGAQRQRMQDYFQNQLAQGDRLSGLYAQLVGPGLDNDAALFGQANSGGIAGANAGVANERDNAATFVDTAKTGASVYDWLSNSGGQ